MEKKVFCSECKFFDKQLGDYSDICKISQITYTADTSIEPSKQVKSYPYCNDKNKDNNCSDYKPKFKLIEWALDHLINK